MKNNIVLCGFMGCGKSTVGKRVAKKLGFKFINGDTYIEQKESKTISEIFSENGEEYFRKVESDAMVELSKKSNTVIATGGGAVINPKSAESLKQTGLLIFIEVTPETVIERLKNDTTRPLLQQPDKETAIKELMLKRYPIYSSVCDKKVNGNQDAKSVAELIGTEFENLSKF